MRIKKAKIEDLIEVEKLICKVYEKFNNKEETKKAVQKYLKHHNPKQDFEKLKENFQKTEIFFVVVEKGKIIGVVRGNKNKVGNLFVEGKFQGKGIAKKLMNTFEKEAKKKKSKGIKIKSSIYAIQFYQKIGYKKSTGIKKLKGLNFQPMIKKLK